MRSLTPALLSLAFHHKTTIAVTPSQVYRRYVSSMSPLSSTAWDEDLVRDIIDQKKSKRSFSSFFGRENRWEIFESVREMRGGDDGNGIHASGHPINGQVVKLDKLFRALSLWSAGLVVWQSIATVFHHSEMLVEEVADRLLSKESAKAVKTVRRIISQFENHGVVDIFKKYPIKDVMQSVLALSKLQSMAWYLEEQDEAGTQSAIDPELLQQLAHYSVFASAAYGWKLEVALRGKLHMGDLQTVLQKTGIKAEDVVTSAWESKTHRPAYFVVRDHAHKSIVLSIRGTLSAGDVLTDLCAAAESYQTGLKGEARAHEGMLEAARGVARETKDVIRTEMEANPEYSLVLVGHSMGGGVAAVLHTLWQDSYPNSKVYGFGSPCVGPLNSELTNSRNIFSVVGEGDPFTCLSLGHVADVSKILSNLCEDEVLRKDVLSRMNFVPDAFCKDDANWCDETLRSLSANLDGEKLYPPGRLFFMNQSNDETGSAKVLLREVPQKKFSQLRLHAGMLDVSRHVPSLYENQLQDL